MQKGSFVCLTLFGEVECLCVYSPQEAVIVTVTVRNSSNCLTSGRAACPGPPVGNPVHHWLRGHPERSYSETPPHTQHTHTHRHAHTLVAQNRRARLWRGEGPGPAHPKWEVQSRWPHPAASVLQVWFQNRRSKERRMKQLSALGARRHAFFRSPRRMRPLVDRLEPGELIPNGPFFYGGGCAAEWPGTARRS